MKKTRNKVSLLKTIFKDTRKNSREKENDERIIYERNKIMTIGMQALCAILVIVGILLDVFRFKIDLADFVSITIGIVHYVMLICYCKKNMVDTSTGSHSFFWSMLMLPLGISNLFLGEIVTDIKFAIITIILSILFVVLLYQIANIIYKKSIKSS